MANPTSVQEAREKLDIALAMLADSVERGGRFDDLDALLGSPDGKELYDGTPIVDAIVAMIRAAVRAERDAEIRRMVKGMPQRLGVIHEQYVSQSALLALLDSEGK